MFESFNLNKFNNNKSFVLDMINNPYCDSPKIDDEGVKVEPLRKYKSIRDHKLTSIVNSQAREETPKSLD